MKVSYKNLQEYFDGKLPSPEALAEALTFHAWEIEEVKTVGVDTMLDVKVLPDKSPWALSHRGIAKDISVILNIPLVHDPLSLTPVLMPVLENSAIERTSDTCTRYTMALITGVKVGPSPKWLVDFLTTLGQRSINNVVDITNYVMFSIGQPLHAFDARKLSSNTGYNIRIRNAHDGERITTLTGEDYALLTSDTLIVDGFTDTPVGIAGIKGGKKAEVDAETVDILLESAHFDSIAIRKSSQRLKLRTDASVRYENGVSQQMAGYGIEHGAKFITKFCGGQIVGYRDTGVSVAKQSPVLVPLRKINSVLGLSLSQNDVASIFTRFGFKHTFTDDTFEVTASFERSDLTIAEDLIEEIGRVYGYEHVVSAPIEPITLREINKSFYYAEKIRTFLLEKGYSEVLTTSFRDTDTIKLANALASDKGYLRSCLYKNLEEAMLKNAGNVELFGTDKVRIFEIGTVFTTEGEKQRLALGVRGKGGVSGKDFQEVTETVKKLSEMLGLAPTATDVHEKRGVIEIDLDKTFKNLEAPKAYERYEKAPEVLYKTFSSYPHAVRDIAFWTPETVTDEEASLVVKKSAGALLYRIDLFDRFQKENKVSYAFRLVFLSNEKTLTAEEVDAVMQSISSAISADGWSVR
jgi:phenylalanyl-tRNA synthetase beta chain